MGPIRSITITPATYRRITLAALIALIAIMVTGAAVRLTDSGLGCADWPTCSEDEIVPRWEYHEFIEGANRLFTGVVSIPVAVAVLGSLARKPRRSDLTRLSLGLVAGIVGQILLGYLTVEFDLWPPVVMGHFLLSIVLITVGLVLYERSGWPEVVEPDRPGWAVASPRRPPPSPAVAGLGRWLLVAGAMVVLTGTIVTGTGPHGGDPDAERLPFDILDVARLHGIAMIVFLASTLVTLFQLRRTNAAASTHRAGTVLVGVLVGQAAVGYAQYLTGVPPLLVGIHVLGAALVWLALIHFWLSLRPPIVTAETAKRRLPERLAVAPG